jgi:hypothetical protein
MENQSGMKALNSVIREALASNWPETLKAPNKGSKLHFYENMLSSKTDQEYCLFELKGVNGGSAPVDQDEICHFLSDYLSDLDIEVELTARGGLVANGCLISISLCLSAGYLSVIIINCYDLSQIG